MLAVAFGHEGRKDSRLCLSDRFLVYLFSSPHSASLLCLLNDALNRILIVSFNLTGLEDRSIIIIVIFGKALAWHFGNSQYRLEFGLRFLLRPLLDDLLGHLLEPLRLRLDAGALLREELRDY